MSYQHVNSVKLSGRKRGSMSSTGVVSVEAKPIEDLTKGDVEDFLYEEAALLDAWRLQEWLSLFTEDGSYEVPAPDCLGGKAEESLFLIADDRSRLESRITRLESPNAHAERPRSRTRRLICNVRILAIDDPYVDVESAFVVFRSRGEHIDQLPGTYEHRLVWRGSGFQIRQRRALLDMLTLRPLGHISFIL